LRFFRSLTEKCRLDILNPVTGVKNSPFKFDGLAKIQIYRGERGGRGGNLFITQGFLRDLRDLCGEKAFFATL
jgi:hypothetical protein